MSLDVKKVGVFSRRVFVLSLLKILAFFIIFGRLFYLQVIQYKKYLEQSMDNRTKYFVIPPKRGIIMDRNGEEIAYNGKYWRVIIKGLKKNFDVLKKTLEILKVPITEWEKVEAKYKKNPFEDFVIYEFLNQEQLTEIELNLPHLPDVYVVEGVARYYKNNFAYSNVLGYIRSPTYDDIEKGISKHPDIKIGASGIEKYYNESLSGVHGYRIVEMDAFGHQVRELATKEALLGTDLKTTLDYRVQEFMNELGQEHSMCSVLMDVKVGGILGIISSPTFDSEKMSQKISQDTWKDIINDPEKPMLNRSYQAGYPPGSVFKIVVALTALENGFNPNKQFYCNGEYRLGKQVFRCWQARGHGMMDLHNAIKHSCNVYFYNLSEYITAEQIKQTAHKLGLGQTYNNLPFYSQQSGLIPDEKWAKATGRGWYTGNLINTIIGQGSVSCSALQLAIMMSRIASEKDIIPNLEFDKASSALEPLNISKESLSMLKSALYDGANTPGGTSYGQRIVEPEYQFAGKTGTAQVVSKFVKIGEAYKIKEEKPNGLFVGFAPFHDPKFAIATIFENGGYGAASALPFSTKVLNYIQKLYDGKIQEAEDFRSKIILSMKTQIINSELTVESKTEDSITENSSAEGKD